MVEEGSGKMIDGITTYNFRRLFRAPNGRNARSDDVFVLEIHLKLHHKLEELIGSCINDRSEHPQLNPNPTTPVSNPKLHPSIIRTHSHVECSTKMAVTDQIKDAVGLGDGGPKIRESPPPSPWLQ